MMKRWMAGWLDGRIVAAMLVGALLGAAPAAKAQDLGIEIGSQAPSAKVHTLDGKELDLAQYTGKTPVVMEFWAIWCPVCKELQPAVAAAAKKWGQQVKFVGVAVSVNESPEKVKAFVAKYQLPGDQYFDTKGNATGVYDVPATSYIVVINKAGKIVYTGQGAKQDLDAAIKKAL